MKGATQKKPKPLTANDVLKYEVAAEVGLIEKIHGSGWRSLTARESGRIGGIMAKRRRGYSEGGCGIDEMSVVEIEAEM